MIPPLFSRFFYTAKVVRILDADTFDLLTDLGHSVYTKQRYRLLASSGGVNAPEANSADPAVRLAAAAATARVAELMPVGTMVWARTEQDRVDGFRRYLAQIWNEEGLNVGDVLFAEQLAVPWVRR